MGRLLLLGGGHTHLAAVATLRSLLPRRQISLLAPSRRLLYSGMMPGWMAGQYRFDECAIDLRAHCERLGVEWIEAEAIDIRFGERYVVDSRGGGHDFESLSINVGSEARLPPWRTLAGTACDQPGGFGGVVGFDGLGAADDSPGLPRLVGAKPFAVFTEAWTRFLSEAHERPGARRLAVAGGGAAAVELAFALARRARDDDALRGSSVALLMAASLPLAGQSRIGGWLASRALARAGVAVMAGHRVVGRDGNGLLCDPVGRDGEPIAVAADFAIVATGAEPPRWLAEAARRDGLTVAEDGGIAVDSRMRSVSAPQVWASGDCASFVDQRVPRSGVHALRQGAALADSIARGAGAAPYLAQGRALALLNRCDGTAIAIHGPWAAAGRWAWRWKDRIDRRFIASFSAGGPGSFTPGGWRGV